MKPFASNLRKRAQELGLPNAEVARRAGVEERRYGHYVSGRNEPDLALLVRIAAVLQTTPDALLNVGEADREGTKRRILIDRLQATAELLSDQDLEIVVAQTEA